VGVATHNWSTARGVVAIGASAGGIDALQRVMPDLPEDLPAAICIVLHIPASSRSLLPQIIARQTALPVTQAIAGERLRSGRVYVAPPDWHVVVRDGHIRLERGPKENGVRPAIDPLFRSVAHAYGRRAIAVVLSGSLSDGAAGAVSVAAAGGAVLVQQPDDAIVPSMPEAAMAAVPEAQACTAAELTDKIARCADAFRRLEPQEAAMFAPEPTRENDPGPPSGLTCPECHGPLWQRHSGAVVRYRCRVGHVFSEEVLLDGKAAAVEAALWMALEALEERGELLEKVATRMEGAGNEHTAARLRDRARGASERAELIRGVLTVDEAPVEEARSESA
jgi:two-component system, chemotaxis family, protein-glutamate methylesterase/glutaminase